MLDADKESKIADRIQGEIIEITKKNPDLTEENIRRIVYENLSSFKLDISKERLKERALRSAEKDLRLFYRVPYIDNELKNRLLSTSVKSFLIPEFVGLVVRTGSTASYDFGNTDKYPLIINNSQKIENLEEEDAIEIDLDNLRKDNDIDYFIGVQGCPLNKTNIRDVFMDDLSGLQMEISYNIGREVGLDIHRDSIQFIDVIERNELLKKSFLKSYDCMISGKYNKENIDFIKGSESLPYFGFESQALKHFIENIAHDKITRRFYRDVGIVVYEDKHEYTKMPKNVKDALSSMKTEEQWCRELWNPRLDSYRKILGPQRFDAVEDKIKKECEIGTYGELPKFLNRF